MFEGTKVSRLRNWFERNYYWAYPTFGITAQLLAFSLAVFLPRLSIPFVFIAGWFGNGVYRHFRTGEYKQTMHVMSFDVFDNLVPLGGKNVNAATEPEEKKNGE